MLDLKHDQIDDWQPHRSAVDNGSEQGLAGLSRRLMDDGVVQFYFSVRDQFPNSHLKDLVAQEMEAERRIRIGDHTVFNFGSDSFLGLDQDPRVQKAIAAGAKKWGTHNGSSRALCSVQANVDAEARLARWLGVEDTLIFPSVTLANMGLLPPLAGAHDMLIVDRLAHNSIQEGAKIAKADGAKLRKAGMHCGKVDGNSRSGGAPNLRRGPGRGLQHVRSLAATGKA